MKEQLSLKLHNVLTALRNRMLNQQLATVGVSVLLVSAFLLAGSYFFWPANAATAQNAAFCLADELRTESLRADPTLQRTLDLQERALRNYLDNVPPRSEKQGTTATSYLVPVVVYIVHDPGVPASNITEQQVNSQLAALNAVFNPRGIEFCLATKENTTTLPGTVTPGIIHISNAALANHDTATEEAALKNVAPVLAGDRYLRIWVVNNIDNNSGVAGYARFPGVGPTSLEGIVIRREVFGEAANCGGCTLLPTYTEGDILAHEVGHYLNLFHPFQGGCSGSGVLDCQTFGDMLCDTPQIATASTGCPTTAPNTCGTPALINNQMDYTNDICRSAFTNGQVSRMLGTLVTARSLLISPANLGFTGVQCASGVNATFTASNYNLCFNQSTTFTAVNQAGATYEWNFGDNTPTATGNPVTHNYGLAIGSHDVTLTVTVSGNSFSSTQQVFVSTCLLSNPDQANWFFGGNAGLSFSTGTQPVAALNSAMGTQEGCITQSNASGQLRFYSDSLSVWNQNHTLLAGGPLNGHQSNSQNSLSVPVPGDPNRYYIFTLGPSDQGNAQLWYTIFDGTTATGALTNVNTAVPLPGTDRLSEQITAIPKCDGNYWLIVHQGNGTRTKFYAYTVTAAGVNPTPVTSSVALDGVFGYLKASPDGTHLAMATRNSLGDTRSALYDFDRTTGAITLRSVLPKGSYGCSFSPDSKLLYTAGDLAFPAGNQPVYQYEVDAPDPAASIIMVTNSVVIGAFDFVSLQLGPDNKVYVNGNVAANIKFLSVINFPNNRSSLLNPNACGFSYNGPSVAPNSTRTGLPNMIDALAPAQLTPDFSYTVTSCSTVKFETPSCASSYLWNFGDSTTSTAQNPSHTYSNNGSFTVTLNLNGGPVEVTRTINVNNLAAAATIAGPATVCLTTGPPIYNYSGSGASGLTYSWSVTGGTISGLSNGPTVDVQWTTLPGTVQMTATDPATGCTTLKTLTVTQQCIGNGTCYNCCGSWGQKSEVGPSARDISALAYASTCNRTILFGGRTPTGGIAPANVIDDTWEWNGNTMTWTQFFPATKPSARGQHALAYDAARQQVVLFGGFNSNFVGLNDTWVYDCGSHTWTQKFPLHSPTIRHGHALAYDPNLQLVVLYGGGSNKQDTWTWNGTDWTEVVGASQPGIRHEHAMAFDGTRVILFGGVNTAGLAANDTWGFTGTGWTQLATTGPNPRQRHALAYDESCQSVILFGGNTNAASYDNDTWQWSGTAWCQTTVPARPAGRQYPALAYDGRGVIEFGGLASNLSQLRDTWRFACNKAYTYRVGLMDNFRFPLPADAPPAPSALFLANIDGIYGTPPKRSFDDPATDKFLLHSFTGLPANIVRAELEIRMRPEGGSTGNDSIHLDFPPFNAPSFTWGRNMFALHPAGTWNPGQGAHTFVLDLCNLPAGGPGQPTNLLSLLNTQRTLSVMVQDDTNVDYIKLRVWLCPPRRSFAGVPVEADGQAQLSEDASGNLTISNIGASGNDGATFTLGEAAGAGLTVTTPLSSFPTNSQLEIQSLGTLNGIPNSVVSTLRAVLGNVTVVTPTTNGSTYHAAFYNTYTSGATSIASVGGLSGGAVSFPKGNFTMSFRQTGKHQMELILSAPVAFSVGGQIVGMGDGIVFTAENPTGQVDSFTQMRAIMGNVTVVSISPLTITALPFFPPTANIFPPSCLAQGNAQLEPFSGGLAVTNLGASGQDGVSLNLGKAQSFNLSLDDIDPLGTAPVGASLQVSTSHILNVLPAPPPRNDLLTVTRTPQVAAFPSGIITMTANFAELGATSVRVVAFNGATQVAEMTNYSGNIISSAWPIGARHNGLATLGYELVFPPSTSIAFGPCPPALCGQLPNITSLRVLPQNPSASVSYLTQTRWTFASGLTEFTLTGATVTTFCQGTLSVAPATLQTGFVSQPYAEQLRVSGGLPPHSFTATGIPAGLTLTSFGRVSGTPTQSGSFNVEVTATDANGCTGTKSYTLVVNDCQPITVNPATLPNSTPGAAYNQTFTATGGTGPYTFARVTGTLPPGLTLAGSGLLSGTPTATGSFNFTVQATDASGCTGSNAYSIVGNCPTITLNPTNPTLPAGMMGTAYSQTFTQTGGAGTITWSNPGGGLPNGLTLNSSTGLLSGTPIVQGNFPFTIKATDSNNCTGERLYSLTINGCSVMTINPANPNLPNGTVGTAYSQNFTQTGGNGTTTWSVNAGTVPNGLTLSPVTGLLSGTPTAAGSFTFTVRATDGNNCFGERQYFLVIGCLAITVNPATLPNGFVGAAYSQTFTQTGGSGTVTWSVNAGTAPAGLTLNATTGLLSGTPTASGAFTFTVRATTVSTCFGERQYTLNIASSGLQFYPLTTPQRLLDTRPGTSACSQPNAPIIGQTARLQPGRGICSIPANAVALTGNLTTVQSGGGFITLYPSDAVQPTVASINYAPNEIINNVFTVGLGPDGAFKLFALNTTDVVVDVTGYYAPPATGGLYFHPLPKSIRILETRIGQAGCETPGTPIQGGEAGTRTQQARISCDGITIPSSALAIVGNATTVNPQGNGFLTLFPADGVRPTVASSNYGTGQIVNGPFTVGLSATGQFKIFSFATTDLVVDVLGYYSPEATDINGAGLLFIPLPKPVRLLETRLGQPVGCFRPSAPLNGQEEYTQTARGVCDGVTIPANALGIVGNATTVQPQGPGFLTLWPSSAATRPTAATANYNTNEANNRHFIVGLGNSDGAFKIYSFATSHLVIDLSGYFAP